MICSVHSFWFILFGSEVIIAVIVIIKYLQSDNYVFYLSYVNVLKWLH